MINDIECKHARQDNLHHFERGRRTFIGGTCIDEIFGVSFHAFEDILELRHKRVGEREREREGTSECESKRGNEKKVAWREGESERTRARV